MRRILFQNADRILTMDPDRTQISHGDIAVRDGVIEAIGKGLEKTGPFDEVIDARGRIITPGFINAHQHCAQTLIRNMIQYLEPGLYDWLRKIYFTLSLFDEEMVCYSTLGSLGDLLKTGCTTTVEHQYLCPKGGGSFAEEQIRAAKCIGIRLMLMQGSASRTIPRSYNHIPESVVTPYDDVFSECVRLIEKYNAAKNDGKIRIGLGPNWLIYESEDYLKEMRSIAERYRVGVTSHLADTREEYAFAKEVYGRTPVEFAEERGFLGAEYFYAHCNQMTKGDYARFARSGTGAVFLPDSDMFLKAGLFNFGEMKKRGISVGIGVDGASNSHSNMIVELKSAYMLQRGQEVRKAREQIFREGIRKETGDITPYDILHAVTAGGAELLGRDDIGSIQPGKAADMVFFDWTKFQCAGGKYDPVALIVFSGDARLVDRVIVGGEIVVEEGRLARVDEEKAAMEINRQSLKLYRRLSER